MGKKYVEELQLTNYKKHKELSLKIEGNSFIVAGKNGGGKSSIFQALLRLLGRLPESNKPLIELTTGEEEGGIRAILAADGTEYFVEEKYTKDKRARLKFSKLSAGGRKDELKPAMERLKELFGDVMDLTPLMDMEGEKQFEYLQKAFKIDVSEYKRVRKEKYTSRTVVGHRVKALRAVLDAPETKIVPADKELYATRKDVQELMKLKKSEVEVSNAHMSAVHTERERERVVQQIKNIEAQLRALQAQRETMLETLLTIENPDLEKTAADIIAVQMFNTGIDEQIQALSEHNDMVTKVSNYIANEQLHAAEVEKQQKLTKEIDDLDAGLQKRLRDIPFATLYDGLDLKYEVDPETGDVTKIGLYLEELPFHRSQQSYGNMIKCLIKLHTFINPDGLNFIYIGDWNLLDEDNQQDILTFAKENENVQLGIEKVDNNDVIEVKFITQDPLL